jgi:ornithine lipid ester-linked acyl 2-hydroxylase
MERPYYRTDGPYQGNAPYFYDLALFPWAQRVRDSWQTIRSEYEENVRRRRDHVVDVFNPLGPKISGWRSVNFQTYLWRYHRAWRSFPVTVALLESIPNLTSAFINVLEPHSAVPVHHGDSNTVVRFHLGLDVPAGDVAVRVGPETRRCSNGHMMAFCDAHEHEAWNATDERRVVFIFDVLRPEYGDQTRTICANTLAATAVAWLENRTGRGPLPQTARSALRRTIGLGFGLWLPVQRRQWRELGGISPSSSRRRSW